jgi:NIMA (never in mitosis gene a)-related kinase
MTLLDSPYIVGYYDSFINDQTINIVIEYCGYGDLYNLIEKHKALKKPIADNVIWKIFINLCLGLHYMH